VPEYGGIRRPRFIIAPAAWYGSVKPTELVISKPDADASVRGDTHLWIFGFLDYSDPFKRDHTTRFAYRMIVEGDTTKQHYPDGPEAYWEYT
jgi:hypothetical protein